MTLEQPSLMLSMGGRANPFFISVMVERLIYIQFSTRHQALVWVCYIVGFLFVTNAVLAIHQRIALVSGQFVILVSIYTSVSPAVCYNASIIRLVRPRVRLASGDNAHVSIHWANHTSLSKGQYTKEHLIQFLFVNISCLEMASLVTLLSSLDALHSRRRYWSIIIDFNGLLFHLN